MPWSAAIAAVSTVAAHQAMLDERRRQHMHANGQVQFRQELQDGLDYVFGTAMKTTGITQYDLGIAGNGGAGGTSTDNERYRQIERYANGWQDPFLLMNAVVPELPALEVIEIPPPTFTLRWYHRVMWRVYKAAVWLRDHL